MKIVAEYDFNGGKDVVLTNYSNEFEELKRAIEQVDASLCKTKESFEKTMGGKILYSPSELNKQFKAILSESGWENYKVQCDYTFGTYYPEYKKSRLKGQQKPYRDMDFLKEGKKLGVEVQFGKYAFMVYNVCAKMTIFKNLGVIDAGIEIVPVKALAEEMSTGVSYFEQFAWDLSNRGVADIDTPVLILGIDA